MTVTPRPFRGSTSHLNRAPLQKHLRLLRDIYVDEAAEPDFELGCRAALVAVPDAHLDRWTAGRWWRLPVDPRGGISFTRPEDAAVSEHDSLLTRRARLHPDDKDVCRGLAVTSLPRTFVDLARYLSLAGLVAVGDVVAKRVGIGPLHEAVRRAGRRKGVVLAREAVLLVDPKSASVAETTTRLVLHAAGFTGLQHGVMLRDAHGGWIGEADLADEQARVCIQYDGAIHFGEDIDGRRRRQDASRDALARMAGWEVVVLLAEDLANPDLMIAKVTAAYERAEAVRRGRLVAG